MAIRSRAKCEYWSTVVIATCMLLLPYSPASADKVIQQVIKVTPSLVYIFTDPEEDTKVGDELTIVRPDSGGTMFETIAHVSVIRVFPKFVIAEPAALSSISKVIEVFDIALKASDWAEAWVEGQKSYFDDKLTQLAELDTLSLLLERQGGEVERLAGAVEKVSAAQSRLILSGESRAS